MGLRIAYRAVPGCRGRRVVPRVRPLEEELRRFVPRPEFRFFEERSRSTAEISSGSGSALSSPEKRARRVSCSSSNSGSKFGWATTARERSLALANWLAVAGGDAGVAGVLLLLASLANRWWCLWRSLAVAGLTLRSLVRSLPLLLVREGPFCLAR